MSDHVIYMLCILFRTAELLKRHAYLSAFIYFWYVFNVLFRGDGEGELFSLFFSFSVSVFCLSFFLSFFLSN